MQVNLFPGQESPLPASSPHAINSHNTVNLKSLESHLAAPDFVSFSHKTAVSNNNESSFSKDIFTLAQGNAIG